MFASVLMPELVLRAQGISAETEGYEPQVKAPELIKPPNPWHGAEHPTGLCHHDDQRPLPIFNFSIS